MNSNKFVKTVLVGTGTMLVLIGGMTAVIDPFFHYHKPLAQLEYPLERGRERYLNNGIIRNFDYDSAITGTSMMQNFKTSQFDKLFDAHSVKVTLTGDTYWAIDEEIRMIFQNKSDIKYIFRCLDYNKVFDDKSDYNYDNVPTYLYDDNPWNDVQYLFNKDIFIDNTLGVVKYTLHGQKMPDMDQYSSWAADHPVGKDYVLQNYSAPARCEDQKEFTEKEAEIVRHNVEENVLDMVKAHPETTFYFYTPPYSALWWYKTKCSGNLKRYFQAEQLQAELLLQYDNVKLFSFTDLFDLTCDLDNYKDDTHYSEQISADIMDWIHDGTYQMTEANYKSRIENMTDYYLHYNYSKSGIPLAQEN
jgi:Fe-S-cluster formation regulator IscX/YfhJ